MEDFTKQIYDIENANLSQYAMHTADTKGRAILLPPCPLRTEYQRDRDRIIHCKAFRRLKRKTQVFLAPRGDHYRTRLTHTLEVSQIARSIARVLRLNEDLVEAISIGHDLGHTPFGHSGERALDDIMKSFGQRFKHSDQSLRVVDHLEYDGKGLNLTYEVRDGIVNHTSKGSPCTLEGNIVQLSDQVAYLNHDIDDAVRAGVLHIDELPLSVREKFGRNHGVRIHNMILDIITTSYGNNFVRMSEDGYAEKEKLRDFMFSKVYHSESAQGEEPKVTRTINELFSYFYDNVSLLPNYIKEQKASKEQKVCDFIATMTDSFAIKTFEELFVPNGWQK